MLVSGNCWPQKSYKSETQICKYRETTKFLAHSWCSHRSGSPCSASQVQNLSLCFVVLNLRFKMVLR